MTKLKPNVNDRDHGTGAKNASVTLVEYGDFQCPHCGRAHPLLQRLLKEMEGELYFVFRHFPLQEIHPVALMAAQAAEAAAKQGKFWPMHDLIFEHQNNLHGNSFLDFAEQLDLNIGQFAKHWKSEEVLEKVELDFESGVRSGVNGTPTFFVNGQPLFSYDGTYESLAEGVRLLA